MPNTFAYFALLSWPVIVLYFFSSRSIEKAIIWSVVGSVLFLPSSFAIDLPGLPALDKFSISSLALVLILPLFAEKRFRLVPQNRAVRALIALLIAGAFLTSMTNQDAIWTGDTLRSGLKPYDALSNIARQILLIVPLLIGWQYLANVQSHREMLKIFLIAGLAYSLLALFEIRMSPQLHSWIYGYFPEDWSQTRRGEGFRPVVFMKHGLWLAFFLLTVMLSTAALWRDAGEPRAENNRTMHHAMPRPFYLLATGYLAVVLLLSKSLGSLLLSIIFVPLVLLTKPQFQLRIAVALTVLSLTYPLLRTADLVPVDKMVEFAATIDADRGGSLATRFENEDRLLKHAQERPWFGWGSWGRNRVYNEAGKDISLTDGYWVIIFGEAGWAGYISRFGLLALPILAVWMRARRNPSENLPIVTSALCLLLGVNLIELLPNATLPPWTWLIAGALLGYAANGNVAGSIPPTHATCNHQKLRP